MPFVFSKNLIVLCIFILLPKDFTIIRQALHLNNQEQKNTFFKPKTHYELEINIEHEDATNEQLLLPISTNLFCQLILRIQYRNRKLRHKLAVKGKSIDTVFREIEVYFRQHYPYLNLSVDHIRIIE